MKTVRDALEGLARALAPFDESAARYLRGVKGAAPQQVADDLFIWGGSGSLMDQAVSAVDRESQRLFESKAIALVEALHKSRAANQRMDRWRDVFESWAGSGQ